MSVEESNDPDPEETAWYAEQARKLALELALHDLREVSTDSVALSRLHELERDILFEVLEENRHLSCNGCVRLLRAIVKKARGEEWRGTV